MRWAADGEVAAAAIRQQLETSGYGINRIEKITPSLEDVLSPSLRHATGRTSPKRSQHEQAIANVDGLVASIERGPD